MNRIKILVRGYARKNKKELFASSTTTLIQHNKINIIVDPGMDRKLLLNALEKERLSPGKINYVIVTHAHLDHSLLAGIFKNTKVLDNNDIYSWQGKIEKHQGKVPGTDIEIIKTPGHDPFHCSVLVKTPKNDWVAIAGDVFWWWDDQKQKTDKKSLLQHQDPYVKNKKELVKSREKILEIADYIIPGHGNMFKV